LLVHIGSTANFLKMLTFKAASEADLGLIALQAGSIATVIVVTAVALLLNSSALELAAGCEIDLIGSSRSVVSPIFWLA